MRTDCFFSTPLFAAATLLLFLLSSCENKEEESAACDDAIGCVEIAPDAPVKIGILQALSGDVADIGLDQVRGIELALETIDYTILGHSIQLQTEDTGCTKEGGANAVLKIIADPDAVAILGTTCSGAAASAAHAMSQAGLVMISGNNSAPFLTSITGKKAPDSHTGYFRTAANEEIAGKTAAIYAFKHLKITRAALINDGDIYTKGLTEGFRKSFEDLGGEIVLDASISKGEGDMSPVLDGVLLARAQLLFFPLFQPEGNRILLQAKNRQEFDDVVLMSDGALISSSFIEKVQDAAKGMYFVGPAKPVATPSIETLAKEYNAKYHSAPANNYYITAYDAAMLLFLAIRKSAVLHPDNSLSIGRQTLRDTLYNTQDHWGVSGILNCDEFGDCATPRFNILQLTTPALGVEGLHDNIKLSYTGAPTGEEKD